MNSSSAAAGSGASSTPNTSNRILVVLSDEQRDEYRADFDPLAVAGIELVYESSAEQALAECMSGDLALVVVGMTMETMDGLEFVAQLMRQNPKFDRKIVVLPEKADPFPPMIQSYDAKSGRSKTEESDLAAVLALAHSFAPAPASVPSPAPAKAPGALSAKSARVSGPSAGPSVAKAGSVEVRRSPLSSPVATERGQKPAASGTRIAPAAPVASLKKTSLGLGLTATKDAPTEPAPPPSSSFAARTESPELVAFSNTVLAAASVPPIPPLQPGLASAPSDSAPAGAIAAAPAAGDGAPNRSAAAGSAAASLPFAAAPPAAVAPPAPVAPPLAAPPQTSGAPTAAAPQNGLPFAAALPDAYVPRAASGALAQARHSAARAASEWTALPRRTRAIIAATALALSSTILMIAFASGSNDESAEPPSSAAREQPRTPRKPAPATPGKHESTISNARNPAPAAPALPAQPPGGETDLRELTTLPLAFERATEAYSVSDAERLSRVLQTLRDALDKDAAARVEVGGHASQEGNARFNWEVAGRRAAAVRDYLQQRGIASSRIKLRSYGTARPLNAGEREENRRVTVRVVQ